MNTKYTVDYFLEKYSKITEPFARLQYIDSEGHRCALGHCGSHIDTTGEDVGESHTEEGQALMDLFQAVYDSPNEVERVSRVNDGDDKRFPQATPRERILAALQFIKSKEAANAT